MIGNFTKRGWAKTDKDDDDWNFYWATVWTVRNLFNPKSGNNKNKFRNSVKLRTNC